MGTPIVDTAFALPDPPVEGAWVLPWQARTPRPQFVDLSIWANATINLTNAVLLAARAHAFASPTALLTAVTNASDLYTKAAHALYTGDGPMQWTTGGTLPSGLSLLADYWVIRVDANTFKVAASLEDALAGTVVAIADDGTGLPTLTAEADCERVVWENDGALLGIAADGAIALTAIRGYMKRVEHHADTVAYALAATMSVSNPEGVSADVSPVFAR